MKRILASGTFVCGFLLLITPAHAQDACTFTYSVTNSFGGGFLMNLNDTNSANELRLNSQTVPFKFLNVPCGDNGTLVRVDVTTTNVAGEYRTAPQGKASFPSRVVVDRYGNTWVANWDEAGHLDGTTNGSITRIGIVIGGTRGDVYKNGSGVVTNFVTNSSGLYLKPPFIYSTAVDRDGDGYIKTSAGLNSVLDWPTNTTGGVAGTIQNADDECIINYVRVPAQLVSAMALDTNNDLWVGGYCDFETPDYPGSNNVCGDRLFVKVDGITGQLLTNRVTFLSNSIPYGGFEAVVAPNGWLWTSGGGNSSLGTRSLVVYDPVSGAYTVATDLESANFGMALDPQTENLWVTSFDGTNVSVYDSDDSAVFGGNWTPLANHQHGSKNAGDLAIDDEGHVWVAHGPWDGGPTVGYLHTDGSSLVTVALSNAVCGPYYAASTVAIDADGKVWAVCADHLGGTPPPIYRIDPSTMEADLCMTWTGHTNREVYGDLTGQKALAGTAPAGVWSVICTNGATNQTWYTVSWNGSSINTNQVRVEVRAANELTWLGTNTFQTVLNGSVLTDLIGQDIEVRVTLLQASLTNVPGLHDLTVSCDEPAPVIVSQPTNASACPGLSAGFSVTATGGTPLTYQWRFNGANLAGQTTTALGLSNVQFTNGGSYTVVITNVYGAVTSTAATLTVWTNATITSGPANTNVCPGQNATFAVTASGTGLNYQWFKGSSLLVNRTSATLTLTNVSSSDAGSYCIAVWGRCTSVTNCATLTVYQPVSITNAPANLMAQPGTNATFTVGAAGTGLTYQWLKGTNVLAGRTNSSLVLTNVNATNAGTYCVNVSGPCNTTNLCASLTVSCLPSPANLAGWWQGETNGYEAIAANNAVLNNVGFTNGEVGEAFVFDGFSAFGYVPASTNLDVGQGSGLTIECWINPGDVYTPGPLVAWDDGSADFGADLWVNYYDTGTLSADFLDTDWNYYSVSSGAGAVASGVFQHVALTYDKASGKAAIYVNGSVVVEQDLGTFTPRTSVDVYLGGVTSWWYFYWGWLDEVGVYNRALGTNEIRAIYDAGTLGRCGISPSFVLQPTNQAVTAGNDIAFHSLAIGTSISYQWFFNSNAIAGATGPALTLVGVQATNGGTYSVQASNTLGGITSSNAVLTVNPAVCYLAPTGLISWWRAESNALDSVGANNGILTNGVTFTAGKVGQAFNFSGNATVVVPDSSSLRITNKLTIETWINARSLDGDQGLVSKLTFATGNHGYQIFVSGNTLRAQFNGLGQGWPWGVVQSGPLLSTGVWYHAAFTYDQSVLALYLNGVLVATNEVGPQTIAATNSEFRISGCDDHVYFDGLIDEVSIYNRALSAAEIAGLYNASYLGKCHNPPFIVSQPANAAGCPGSSTNFDVAVTGDSPLGYQWRFNGANLAGQTTTNLALSSLQSTNSGSYTVVITNVYGAVTSAVATLTVWTNATIVSGSANTNVCPGQSATFAVSATGTGLIYQWYKGTGVLTNRTSSALILTNVTASDAGTYSVVVQGACSSVTNSATLTVYSLVSITNAPADLTVQPGTNATFTVGAAGTGLTYQWLKGTNVLAGQTNGSLVFTNVNATNAGTYCVTVTGTCSSSNLCASLTVSCLPSPANLVAWWQGETNGYEAIAANNAALNDVGFTNGEVGGAFVFDGVSAFGYVPAATNLDVGQGSGLTIECWIKPGDLTTPAPVIAWEDGYGAEWISLWVNYADVGTLTADVFDSDLDNPLSSASGVLSTEVYQHVAMTFDKSSSQLVLYLNGTALGSHYLYGITPYTATDVYLGGDPFWNSYYRGRLDEVGVYGRALGTNEIRAIYDAGSLGRCGILPSFVRQPSSQTNTVGNYVLLSSLATGTSLSYQWYFNGGAVAGGTNPSLAFDEVQTNQAGAYAVHVSSPGGTITSATAVLTVNPAVCYEAPTGLIGWWRAETNAYDSVGTNNGTMLNGATFASGRTGGGFSFDGSSQCVQIAWSPSLVPSNYTIETWINPTATVDSQVLLFGQSYGYCQLLGRPGRDWGHIAVQFGTNHYWFFGVNGQSEIPIGEWSHVAGSWDGTTLRVYVNGVLDGTNAPGTMPVDSGCAFYIGGFYTPDDSNCGYVGQFFEGVIDEVAYYGRALSSAEIAGIYNASYAGKCQDPPGITMQPTNQNVGVTSNVIFTVSATGTPQLHYQWKFDGTNISGGTRTSLTLTNVQSSQAGTYTVQVTNAFGSTLSSNAILTVTNSAIFVQITNPVNQVLFALSSNTIIATATSTDAPISRVLFKVGTNELGVTTVNVSNTYQFPWQPASAGTYVLTAQAQNTNGEQAWSAPVTNIVVGLPVVRITSPTNTTILGPSPTNITLNASASADGTNIVSVTYYQGANILGSNTVSPYSVTWSNVNDGVYILSAVATDGRGAVGVSSNITITVDSTNHAPYVYAGPDQTIVLSSNAFLSGTVWDDGLPRGDSLTVSWTRTYGLGTAAFIGSQTNTRAEVSFSTTGSNGFQLVASDGQYSTTSSVTVFVLSNNLAPIVSAGTNQTVVLPALTATNFLSYVGLSEVITNAGTNAIGIAYHAPSGGLIIASRGIATNLYLFSTNKTNTLYSPLSRGFLTFPNDEVKIVTVTDTNGGFNLGDLFCGNGNAGEIVRIEPDGTVGWHKGAGSNAWVTLPYTNGDSGGDLQGAMCVDSSGLFGGDLLVVTRDGALWRINSAGATNKFAQLNPTGNGGTFDGMTVVPDDANRYGPWSGRILVGSDGGLIYAVDTNGAVVTNNLGISDIEEFLLVPDNESLFIIDTENTDNNNPLWSVGPVDLANVVGDFLIATEDGWFRRVHWTGVNFDVERFFKFPGSVEHATFAPMNQIDIGQVHLGGCVHDDGLIWTTNLISWSKESGPGPVTFLDSSVTNTVASFSVPGSYSLRLTAFDGQFTSYTNVIINVVRNQAPVVSAGTNQMIATNWTTLYGTVADDGLPWGITNVVWSQTDGPGTATFTNGNHAVTTVGFSASGVYILRLTADDGQATNAADVVVAVESASMTLTPASGSPTSTDIPYSVSARLVNASNQPIVGSTIEFAVSNRLSETIVLTNWGITDSNGIARLSYSFPYSSSNFLPNVDQIIAWTTNAGLVVSAGGLKTWMGELSCPGSVGSGPGLEGLEAGGPSVSWPGHVAVYCEFMEFAGTPITLTPDDKNLSDIAALMVVKDPVGRILGSTQNQPFSFTAAISGEYVVEMIQPQPDITNMEVSVSVTCEPTPPQLALLFNGTNVPDGATVYFPPTAVSQSATQTFVITNLSSEYYSMSSVVLAGGYHAPVDLSSALLGPNGSTNLDVIFTPLTSGQNVGQLSVAADSADFSETVYLSGNAWPTGAPPTVQISVPTNGAVVVSGSGIQITAAVTPGLTNVSYVEFRQITANGTITLGRTSTGTANNYSFLWPNNNSGDYTITAAAVDDVGRVGVSSPVLVHLKSSNGNHAPVANGDQYMVLANSSNNVFKVLANDTDSDGDPLTITAIILSTTPSPHGTPVIINNGTAISYTPPPGLASYPGLAGDGFSYQISDGRGGTALGGVLINIFSSDQPTVTITSPSTTNTFPAGTNVAVTAHVDPSQYISRVEYYIGTTLVGTVTNGSAGDYIFNWTALYDANNDGVANFTATAYDNFGQYNTSQPVPVTVTPPAGASAPVARIDSLAATVDAYGQTKLATLREGILKMYGAAYQIQGSNVIWHLGVYDVTGALLQDFTPTDGSNTNAGSATSSNLMATCDFSTLQNGIYNLTLTAVGAYQSAQASVQFRLESRLKIGQFSFSQQDMVIPVNGVPLTVTRTYSSLNRDKGDFGYGWTWILGDMDVEFDEYRENVPDLKSSGNKPFSLRAGGGRDVTLTLPGGQRTTFSFYYDGPGTCFSGDDSMSCFHGRWQAAPGVTATLDAQCDTTLIGTLEFAGGNAFWAAADETVPLDSFDFPGFILTTQDGTQYYINRDDLGNHYVDSDAGSPYPVHAYGAAHLQRIVQRTKDSLVIQPSGIYHQTAGGATDRQIVFQRNSDGLISAIYDPTAQAGSNALASVIYQYDSSQNLINVLTLVDRTQGTYLTNTFQYTNSAFPHYISGIIDPRGIPVAHTEYDNKGRITAVVDADGNRTQFSHNTSGKVEVVIDRLGHTNSYGYDLRGNVIATTNAVAGISLSAYDDVNNKTNQIDYLNGAPYATNSWVYDTNINMVLASVNPLGYSNVYTYNTNAQMLTSTDARGNTSTNYYDAATGSRLGTSDALADSTTNAYNSNNQMLYSVDAVGTVTTNHYDGNQNLDWTAAYDQSGILSSNSFAYDANANQISSTAWRHVAGVTGWVAATTSYVYDGQNRVVYTVNSDGGTNTVVYNEIGKQGQTIDPLGRVSSYTYDAQGRLTNTTYADLSSESSAYDSNGNRISSTDKISRVTTYVYDAMNRLVQTIYPDNTTNATVYDVLGRVQFNVDARGTITATGYDVAGQRIAVTNAWGTSIALTNGAVFDGNGNQVLSIDALGHSTTTVYDKLNRSIQMIYADATTNFTGYDRAGRRMAQTNQDGIVTRFGYDGAGRLTFVTNAFGTTQQIVTKYQYDEAGNEVAQVDALNHTTSFAYDGMGRRIRRVLPQTQSETMGYDVAGNQILLTNFNGIIITNQYDSMNQLTNSASTNGYCVSFAYSPTGQRQVMVDAGGTNEYAYDMRDRLIQRNVTWIRPGTYNLVRTLRYLYDKVGEVTDIWSDSDNGVKLHYDYDQLNRLTNVLSRGTAIAGYGFDGAGNLRTVGYGNGATNLCQYDSMNRLTHLVWKSGTTNLASFYYQLGSTGNRTNLNETVNGTNLVYAWQYDNLYRMTSESITNASIGGLADLGYVYDNVGNRLRRFGSGSMTNTLPATTNSFSGNDWLTSDSYDASGNTLSSTNDDLSVNGPYGYDVENHLTNFNNGAVTIVYDGDGRRVSKNNYLWYLVDDRNPTGYPQVLEEHNGDGVSKVYNYGMQLVSQEDYSTSPSVVSYFVRDGHGSTRLMLDTDTSVVGRFVYNAYGSMIASNSTVTAAYLYCGEQFDSDLGMYYLRARYYDPQFGRFLTRDGFEGDLEQPMTLHKYGYCNGDPIDSLDPRGLAADSVMDVMSSLDSWQSIGIASSPTTFLSAAAGGGGPDVTIALKNTLNNAASWFGGLDGTKQFECARELRSYSAGHAWDIKQLWDIRPPEVNHIRAGGKDYVTGTGAFQGSVAVEGEVYYASAVNYALFGKESKVAHDYFEEKRDPITAATYSLTATIACVRIYKRAIYPLFSLKWPDFSYEYGACSEAFAAWGYNGTPLPRGLITTPSKDVLTEAFEWMWMPHHPD